MRDRAGGAQTLLCFCVNITSNTQLRTGEVLQRGVEAVVEVNQADTMMPER